MRRNSMFTKLYYIACILTIMSLFTNSNAATLDLELLNKQTVKIEVGSEIGSGVLLCQKDDQINILTAKHVFDSSYETIRVDFYRDYCNTIKLSKKDLQIKSSGTLDIALLQIQLNKVQSCPFKFIPIGTSNTIKLGQEVTTTGHQIGEREFAWLFQQGKVNREVGEYITHSCKTTQGYSGGPLVNERGELIGINVVVEGNVGQAIPIDSILPFLREYNIPIDVQSEKPGVPQVFRFRSKPKRLNEERGFYDSIIRSGFSNEFIPQYNGLVVFDQASGLTWQQSGSTNMMMHREANAYVEALNSQNFAGYRDWRLPTCEEAVSLIEPTQMNGDLYIDPKFDKQQQWIWTSDTHDMSSHSSFSAVWVASFEDGTCFYCMPHAFMYVRAVR